MVDNRPRARALFIWMIVGLAIIATYFIFIASNEGNNNGNTFGGGAAITSTLRATPDTSATPIATLSVEQTPTP